MSSFGGIHKYPHFTSITFTFLIPPGKQILTDIYLIKIEERCLNYVYLSLYPPSRLLFCLILPDGIVSLSLIPTFPKKSLINYHYSLLR